MNPKSPDLVRPGSIRKPGIRRMSDLRSRRSTRFGWSRFCSLVGSLWARGPGMPLARTRTTRRASVEIERRDLPPLSPASLGQMRDVVQKPELPLFRVLEPFLTTQRLAPYLAAATAMKSSRCSCISGTSRSPARTVRRGSARIAQRYCRSDRSRQQHGRVAVRLRHHSRDTTACDPAGSRPPLGLRGPGFPTWWTSCVTRASSSAASARYLRTDGRSSSTPPPRASGWRRSRSPRSTLSTPLFADIAAWNAGPNESVASSGRLDETG